VCFFPRRDRSSAFLASLAHEESQRRVRAIVHGPQQLFLSACAHVAKRLACLWTAS